MIERLKAPLRAPYSWLLDFLSRWSARRIGLGVMYHGVGDTPVPADEQITPLFPSELFEAQIRHLSGRYRLVPASKLLDAVRERRRGQRIPVAITFDDDLASHLEIAMPILKRAQAPATFYLTGASMSGPFAFWWERLQRAFDRGLVDEGDFDPNAPTMREEPPGIRRVASAIEAMPPRERDRISESLLGRLREDPPGWGLRAAQIREMVANGLEIGFHTRRHEVMTMLGDDQLAHALREGRGDLETVVGYELSTFAYPSGMVDARVAEATRDAGFESGFTTETAAVSDQCNPLLLPRVTPTLESPAHFAMQVASVLHGPTG